MRTPGGKPEVYQGVHGELAEAMIICIDAKILSLCVVHEGENVFV